MAAKRKVKPKKAQTLVEIMVVVAAIATLAAIGIPNLLRAKINANEAVAQATLKSYAGACESYIASTGIYPTLETDLTSVTPPYFPRALNGTTKSGYAYDIALGVGGYTLTANAVSEQTGNWNYRMTTGAILMRQPQDGGAWESY